MTQKDATEGGTTERIPPHAEPGDVIYGNPSDIDALVVKLRAYAGAFKDGNAQLDVLAFKDWTGAAAENFETAVEKLPRELTAGHKYFSAAATALDAYADKLRSVHKRLKPLIADADAARAASKKYWREYEAYAEAEARGDSPLPDKPAEDDPGIAALEACYRRLDKLEEEVDDVVRTAKRKLDDAAEKAPDKPKGVDPNSWEGQRKQHRDFLRGVGDWGLDTSEMLESLVADGPGSTRLQLAGMVDGVAYAVDHPKEFAKAAVNWDEWQRNPARAAGQLSPDLLLALATGGGAGTGAKRGMSAVRTASQRLRGRVDALRRDGSARRRTDSDPDGDNTPARDQPTDGEPVNVTNGRMVMSATDVSLPGALPLVLERHYSSGHPCGGWFGATWAATLDERLELDDQGVVYVSEDGMLLTYPVPEPDVPVYPSGGPRWPLSWDGKPDGTMTVTFPERGQTRHFSRLPVGGPELALCAIADRGGEGDRVTFTYDADGVPTEISHSGGYRLAVDTDPALSRVTALRLLHGERHEHSTTLVSYGYDQAGDLTEVRNSTGLPLRFRYDDEHRMTSWTDRNGTSFGYVYDHRGRVLRTVGPDGIQSGRFHYDPAARTTVYTDSEGHATTYVHDAAYKVVAETDALGNTVRTEWDEESRDRLSVTDALGRTTRFTYDTDGNLTSVTRPDDSVTEAVYDDWGLPVEVREPGGGVWRHTYDARGARTSTTDPAGATTRFGYDDRGHLSSVTDPLGAVRKVTTDGAGLPLTVTDPGGGTTRLTRGPHGQITALTDPSGRTTRQGWTIEGRPAWRESPDGGREEWKWDPEGNLAAHVDAMGHTTEYTYTHFDVPATRTDPDGSRYAFAYDTELRLTTVTGPRGAEWHYAYDAAGRLVSETDFNGATRTYGLDAAGQLVTRTNAVGEPVAFTRDVRGRVTEQRDGTTDERTVFAYDARGALVRAANGAAELTLERDPLGRILSETVNGRTVAHTYDAAGNRIARTTPSGVTSSWTYDAAGRPTALSTGGHVLTFAYDEAGRETARTVGAVTLSQSWDAADRLTAQRVTGGDGQDPIQHRTYRYRPDGCLTEVRDLTAGTRRYDLDRTGRVRGVQAHGWTEWYAYDETGNLTEASAPNHPEPGPREFTGTLIRRAGRTRYEHDAAGRLIRSTRKLLDGRTRTWTYRWNAEDQLTGVTTPGGEEWTYAYDPLGRRIAKTGPDGTSVHFAWDSTTLAEQTAPDGTILTWDHAPGTHRPLTQTVTDPLTPPRFHAVITDATGTPAELVTPDGELAWRARTALWGTPLPAPSAGPTDCPLRFPGQYADPETGLHYNYFRYYDPTTARYLSPDPLGLAPSPNPHSYVRNPLTWLDPLGLGPCRREFEQGNHLGDAGRLGGWLPDAVPEEALESIDDVNKYGRDATGWGSQWHGPNLVMERFENSGKNGGYVLPERDPSGKPITYMEYGAPAAKDNPKPGGERTVWGSDGSVYYTPTHYQTFIVVESPKW